MCDDDMNSVTFLVGDLACPPRAVFVAQTVEAVFADSPLFCPVARDRIHLGLNPDVPVERRIECGNVWHIGKLLAGFGECFEGRWVVERGR
jgi:hypothetical protein